MDLFLPVILADPTFASRWPDLGPESSYCNCPMAPTVTDCICHRPSPPLLSITETLTLRLTVHPSLYVLWLNFMSLPQWSSLKRFSLFESDVHSDVHYEGKGVSNRSVFLRCPPNPAVVTAGHPAAIRLSFLCGLSLWLLL